MNNIYRLSSQHTFQCKIYPVGNNIYFDCPRKLEEGERIQIDNKIYLIQECLIKANAFLIQAKYIKEVT